MVGETVERMVAEVKAPGLVIGRDIPFSSIHSSWTVEEETKEEREKRRKKKMVGKVKLRLRLRLRLILDGMIDRDGSGWVGQAEIRRVEAKIRPKRGERGGWRPKT
jgi:hypothetical protein